MVVRAVLLSLTLVGCAQKVVRVEVPVPVMPEVPAELLTPLVSTLPIFVSPSDPAATSALTPEGELALKNLLYDLRTRVELWEHWVR